MTDSCPAERASRVPGFRYTARLRGATLALVLTAAVAITSRSALAQRSVGGRNEVFAGSDLESYLRYLQTAGKSAAYPWTIRSFSASEIDSLVPSDAAHPWALRYDLQRRVRHSREWDYVRPQVNFSVNTAFPYGGNDGAVWQGKGLTTWIQGGLSARWGPFSAVLAPIAFDAENQSFPLMPNGETGRLQFAHGMFPTYIDLPQRFGTLPYRRVDWGQSTIRFDGFGVAAGLSSANQWWGPTDQYPFILGNNAPGFPHVFLGTARPVNVWVGKIHTRLVYGGLKQSPYSSVTGPKSFVSFSEAGTRRFMAGLIGTLEPRGAPGLEIGGARFFHAASDPLGYWWYSKKNFQLPLQHLFKAGLPKESDVPIQGGTQALKENQLASLFLRWAPPGSGFEAYAEYGRDDHALDRRDLIVEPDHSSAMNAGFRKAWLSPRLMQAVRGEIFTYERAAGSRTRGEGQMYIHGILRQGHTEMGQMLGANVGPGSGSAEQLAYDRYTTSGRLTFFVSREVQHEFQPYRIGLIIRRGVDAFNSVGAEATRFIGPFDIMGRVTFTNDLNRYFVTDRSNANLAFGVRQSF